LLGQISRPMQIGDEHGVAASGYVLEGRHDPRADEIRQSRFIVDDGRDLYAAVERTDHRDLRKIGNAGERNPAEPAFSRDAEDGTAFGLGAAEKAEGDREVFDGQA
jgi:hypothetical protein